MQKYPAVSVIISTYNRAAMLRRALASCLAQKSAPDFEVVVVDDASTDSTFAAVQSLDKQFRLRGVPLLYFKLSENTGYQCRPKNIGVQHCNGEFIAYLDDDNTFRSNHLAELFAAILRAPEPDLVYGMREYHADRGCVAPVLGIGRTMPFSADALARGNYIDTSDILHSKGAYYELANRDGKGWDEDLQRFGDWNFVYRWAKCGLTGRPVYRVLTDYYWHGQNLQLTRPVTQAPVRMSEQDWKESQDAVSRLHADPRPAERHEAIV